MSDQQLGFLVQLVDVAKQQSDTLNRSAERLQEALAVRSGERVMLEKLKHSQNGAGGGGVMPGFGEKNETVKQFFAEMGRALLDDMERPLEDLESSLQRIQILTRYFSEYSGALLPPSHENQWGKGADDSKRQLEKYRLVRDQVFELREEVMRLAMEETSASQTVDRLERQAKIDVGAGGDGADGGGAAVDAKAKDKEATATARLEQAKADCAIYKKDYQASVEKLKAAQAAEKIACKQLQDQMAQFEFDRAEFMQLALGDLFHGGLSYHSQALNKYARLCEYEHSCAESLISHSSQAIPNPCCDRG